MSNYVFASPIHLCTCAPLVFVDRYCINPLANNAKCVLPGQSFCLHLELSVQGLVILLEASQIHSQDIPLEGDREHAIENGVLEPGQFSEQTIYLF